MLLNPSPVTKLSLFLGPPPPSSVTYFMDAPFVGDLFRWCIGVDSEGSPGTCPLIIEKRSCIYHFLPPFPSNILVCPPNIFDKSTPVRWCICSFIHYGDLYSTYSRLLYSEALPTHARLKSNSRSIRRKELRALVPGVGQQRSRR